jgi:hypothetical protein
LSQCPQRLLFEGIEIFSPVTVAVDTSAQQRDCRNWGICRTVESCCSNVIWKL